MRTAIHLAFALSCIFLFSCKGSEDLSAPPPPPPVPEPEVVIPVEAEAPAEEFVQLPTVVIDGIRSQIEVMDKQRTVITAEKISEMLKREFSEIHFYSKDGAVVRIKTYPKEGITRSKEFYFENGDLILVAVHEDITKATDDPYVLIDRMYYYRNGEVIGGIIDGEELESFANAPEPILLMSEAALCLELYQP